MILKKIVGKEFKEDKPTYLIIGLGNPGREYKNTRHNIGFMVVDKINTDSENKSKKIKFNAVIFESKYKKNKVIFAKPMTYMNLSGQAVCGIIKYYKVKQENVLVVHDDLDLPFGTIRLRATGGAGGHKGLQSIINQLKTKDFARMRLGIGRPPGKADPSDFVLKNFSRNELNQLDHGYSKKH